MFFSFSIYIVGAVHHVKALPSTKSCERYFSPSTSLVVSRKVNFPALSNSDIDFSIDICFNRFLLTFKSTLCGHTWGSCFVLSCLKVRMFHACFNCVGWLWLFAWQLPSLYPIVVPLQVIGYSMTLGVDCFVVCSSEHAQTLITLPTSPCSFWDWGLQNFFPPQK